MVQLRIVNIFAIFIICLSNQVWAQGNQQEKLFKDVFPINIYNKYEIAAIHIKPGSEIVRLLSAENKNDSSGRSRLLAKNDYSIDYEKGVFSLSQSLPYSIYDTLEIVYLGLNLRLRSSYFNRELTQRYDDVLKDTVKKILSTEQILSSESIFGNEIEKSGTILRGFTVGTNKDFSLQSGLRLQLAGKLSEDIDVVAALTDESTPIQPEGNTERLDELDKVFIQIKHKNATGTFGDYELNKKIGEFGNYNKRLQGLAGEYIFGNHSGYFGIASSKGKFNSLQIAGVDGVQGPYILYGVNNEKDIIIIAGSEKVFLDGEEVKRGERNDYIIDYSNSQITFTPNRLITSSTRISIDFEYADRKYIRNVFTGGAESRFFDDKLKIQFSYFQEGDDKDSPIDFSLSDNDKEVLKEAGDDINKATKSGVSLAEADSTGKIRGVYEKKDTLINNENITYYVYNPGSDSALYNLSFSYLGNGNGDYIKESLGRYSYVGKNLGQYNPVIFLPLPELKQFSNIVINYVPFKYSLLSLELAGSSRDKNRFSTKDEEDNLGYARNIVFTLSPIEVSVFNSGIGKIGFSLRERFIQSRFTSIERFGDVEFNREYNVNSSPILSDETLREIRLNYLPIENLNIVSTYGYLKKGDSFSSDRVNTYIDLSSMKDYSLNYNLDYVNSTNPLSSSKWVRQRGKASVSVFSGFGSGLKFTPVFDFLAENKSDRLKNDNFSGVDSLIAGSLKNYELNPGVELSGIWGLKMGVRYTFRNDSYPIKGKMETESNSFGYEYSVNYNGIREVNSDFKITLREKKYSEVYKNSGYLDNQSVLIRSQSKFLFLDNALNGDLYYEAATQKTAKLERVFVQVPKGTGNYKYLGDINNNGIMDENEFEPTLFDGEYILMTIPTDKLFPVIELKTSTRWKLVFRNIDGNSIWGKILKSLSFESFVRIEENSSEEKISKIYLMDFASFQNENTTIRGNSFFQQDIFIFENDHELSFRLRYSQRKSLNQYSSSTEKGYFREQSLRIKFRMIQEISNQTDVTIGDDNLLAAKLSLRNRTISSSSLNSDFSYRPSKSIEVGFVIKAAKNTDSYPSTPTIIDLNGQMLRFNVSFSGTGRLRIELERNELLSNTTENSLPFELVGGNQIGKNYFWRLNYDYRVMSNLQTSASYEGRQQGGGKVIHSLRAEARAFF